MKELVGTEAVRAWLESGEAGPVAIQNAELDTYASALSSRRLAKSVLLGCVMGVKSHKALLEDDAVIVPDPGLLPPKLCSFPIELYTVASLYAGFDPAVDRSWEGSPDCQRQGVVAETHNRPELLSEDRPLRFTARHASPQKT